ncbi:MAG: hypothetical protein HYY04_01555 [Chloroflexi bacterium]|nr:hypothetical protein [Chloroflexota bacterium]
MATTRQQLFVVSHTHWDREWHQPFQRFRLRLVQMIDDLLALLAADPDFRHFTLDGQSVVVEDYLAVRPERHAEVARHIQSGRLLTGPWYVMPDEFLVSAESLVRNLLRGTRLARELGEVMSIGYLPDSFGHIAQLPQILRGFGIDTAVIWRGVGGQGRHTEFSWRAPDGSAVLAIYLRQSYNNAAHLPTRADDLLHRIAEIRRALSPYATTPNLLLMNGDDHQVAQASIGGVIRLANARLRDAELIHATLPQYAARVRAMAPSNGPWETLEGEFRSSELAHLLAGILSTRIGIKQRNAQCEDLLERWAEPFSLYAGLVEYLGPPRATGRHGDPGTRGHADGTTRDAEMATPNGETGTRPWGDDSDAPSPRRPAEPRATSRPDGLVGEGARQFLRLAWQHLLHCQPHDSICGCSVDQVHEEMAVRFDTGEQVAREVADHSLRLLASRVDTARLWSVTGERWPRASGENARGAAALRLPRGAAPDATAVVVFNSEGGPRDDYATAVVPPPAVEGDLALVPPDGQMVPVQVLGHDDTEVLSDTLSATQLRAFLAIASGSPLAPLRAALATLLAPLSSLLTRLSSPTRGPGSGTAAGGEGRPSPPGEWPRWRIALLERMVGLLARGRLPELAVRDIAVRPGHTPDVVEIDVDAVERGEHSYDAIARALREVEALVNRGDVRHFRVRARRCDWLRIGFVARGVPAYGFRTYRLVAWTSPLGPLPDAWDGPHPQPLSHGERGE